MYTGNRSIFGLDIFLNIKAKTTENIFQKLGLEIVLHDNNNNNHQIGHFRPLFEHIPKRNKKENYEI